MVNNPTPIHINVMSVIVDGKDITLNMIKLFETIAPTFLKGLLGVRWYGNLLMIMARSAIR